MRGPGLPGWPHEDSLGAAGRICKWTTEEEIWGCFYPRKQSVIHKHTEEKGMKTPRMQYFSYLDIYAFMRFFFWSFLI